MCIVCACDACLWDTRCAQVGVIEIHSYAGGKAHSGNAGRFHAFMEEGLRVNRYSDKIEAGWIHSYTLLFPFQDGYCSFVPLPYLLEGLSCYSSTGRICTTFIRVRM